MDKKKCSSCGEAPHKCSCKNKEFTKAVIEIDNPEQITLMRRVVIPASMGDDTTVPPTIGKYHNVLLYYEANQKSYLYSSDGIPTQLVNGFTNYEEAINLPEINGVTLIGDKSSADLKLSDAPMVITVANGNTSWSGADTAEDVYDFFLNKGKVNIIFNGEENYSYEVASAAYIPAEEKMMCTLAVASIVTGETSEFEGNALFGTMTLYTANKAIDVSQIDLQPKLYVTDFTGLDLNYNELSGVPATDTAIGMVKPGDGLEVDTDGTLSISDIEQHVHFFDTVADMKAATNLVGGSYAQTLGYHALNDDGGATYKIRTITNSDVVDNGSIIALADNALVAELIFEGKINVKQFGAYGDGTHDDGTAIQTAIDFIDNKAHTLGRSMVDNQLQIPGGKYKISDTIELKTTVKLRTIGMASFEYYGSSVAIWIMNDWTSGPDDRFSAGEWLAGAIIDGVGLNIKNMNATDSNNATDRGNTTGLEVGVRSSGSYNSYNRVSVTSIRNIKITNFNVGIKINTIYTFVETYEYIDILRCNTCVQFGTSGGSVNNGTEKMGFMNCMFGGGCDVIFLWNVAPVHIGLYNCSLDYSNVVFLDSESFNNPNNISIIGGHIEGIGEGLASNPSGKAGLIDGNFNRSTLVIDSPVLAIRNEPRVIRSATLKDNLRIIFNNIEMNYSSDSDTLIGPDYTFMSNRPVEAHIMNSNSYIADYSDGSRSILMRMLSQYNSLVSGCLLQNATTGPTSISNNTPIGSFIIKSSGNISSGSIAEDNPITGGKVITLVPSAASSTFQIKTGKIRANSNTWYKTNMMTLGATSREIVMTFYDIDDNVLYETGTSVSGLNLDKTKWYASPYSKVALAPAGTDYVVVSYKAIAQNNTELDYIKIGGCFLEEI